jgi:iron(III) transport system permease protein
MNGLLPGRDTIDLMPAITLVVVVVTSAVVVCLLAVVVWLSWTSGRPGDPALGYTAQNFVEVFSDRRTYIVLIDTFGFALIALVVAVGFGIPAAWLAERTDIRAKMLLFTLMAMGLLIPGFATAMGWLFLMHPRIGLVNQLLVSTFHLSAPPFNITSIVGMGWVQGLNLAPLAFIMTAAVFVPWIRRSKKRATCRARVFSPSCAASPCGSLGRASWRRPSISS